MLFVCIVMMTVCGRGDLYGWWTDGLIPVENFIWQLERSFNVIIMLLHACATGTFTTHSCNRDTECRLNELMSTLNVGSFSFCSAHCGPVLSTCTRKMVLYEQGKYSETFVYSHVLIVVLLDSFDPSIQSIRRLQLPIQHRRDLLLC